MLAYGSGILSVAGFAFYLIVFVGNWLWLLQGRLVAGRSLAADPAIMIFYQALIAALFTASLLAVKASNRMLERPNGKDLRAVISFNLLAVWMFGADQILRFSYRHGYGYEFGITLACAFFAGLALLWAVWMKRVSRPPGVTVADV